MSATPDGKRVELSEKTVGLRRPRGLRLVYPVRVMNNQVLEKLFLSLWGFPIPILRWPICVFYSSQKPRQTKIEIDHSSISCDSLEVQERLSRIEANYEQLETILGELELQMGTDERLKAIDDANADFEQTFGIKRKRKWRPSKTKSKAQSKRRSNVSVAPRKPR